MKLRAKYILPVVAVGLLSLPAIIDLEKQGKLDKQKISRAVVRECVMAVEEFRKSQGHIPNEISEIPIRQFVGSSYIRTFPIIDGWSNPIKYEIVSEIENGNAIKRYYIGSAGSDGKWEHPSLRDYPKPLVIFNKFEGDIVYYETQSISIPEGCAVDK